MLKFIHYCSDNVVNIRVILFVENHLEILHHIGKDFRIRRRIRIHPLQELIGLYKYVCPKTRFSLITICSMRNISGNKCHIPSLERVRSIVEFYYSTIRMAYSNFQTVVKMKLPGFHIRNMPSVSSKQ